MEASHENHALRFARIVVFFLLVLAAAGSHVIESKAPSKGAEPPAHTLKALPNQAPTKAHSSPDIPPS